MIAATKVQQSDPPHTMRESNRQRADAYHELLLLLQPVLCCVAPPLTRSWQFAPLLASAALLHAAQLTRLQHKKTGCRSACCADMIHAQLKTHYHSTGGHTQGCSKWKCCSVAQHANRYLSTIRCKTWTSYFGWCTCMNVPDHVYRNRLNAYWLPALHCSHACSGEPRTELLL